ncbi:MAG: ATP-binding protein [Oscillospiraceae bacterium]|nr:ATP-binding protein [Oscillospiraceae bacterium]
MLLQFNFKNYLSFRDDTTLDLTATKITEYPAHVVAVGKEKVLPLAAIYGANASGKSNVQDAFVYMSNYVINSFSYGGDNKKDIDRSDFAPPTPFLLDTASMDAETSFEVYFITSKQNNYKSYNYGFTIGADGIHEEWLNSKAKTAADYKKIFYRNGSSLDLSGLPQASQSLITIALEPEALIVSLGAKLRISELKLVRDWFYDNEIANFGNPSENLMLSSQVSKSFVTDRDLQHRVAAYFSSFDPSIRDFHISQIEEVEDDGSGRVGRARIDAVHQMVDSDEFALFPLSIESAGTLKMFALYPLLQSVLQHGSVLFVDELNARLHPLLLRTILIMFLDPKTNPNHAQLIFTTHDAWHLSLLRRDEIWFTEKDEQGISTLYSLVDFEDENGTKIRKDENYIKNYLLGKYGGIPSVHNLDILGGE